MRQTDGPTIEVSISPELRQLLSHRRGDSDRRQKPNVLPAPVDQNAPEQRFRGLPMHNIRVRQDGARPFRFLGATVFDIKDRWQSENGGFVHQFTLFLKDSGSVYAAAHLEPEKGLALRPSYRCAALGDSLQLNAWVENWRRDVVGPALAHITPHRRQASDEVSSAFQTLTGDCLRSASPLFERNEKCHQ